MKKLIPAIVMLVVSAVVLSTASYAWFTTAENVSASGMQVTASAPASILIRGASNNTAWTAFSSQLNFADIYSGDDALLTPTSSWDGVTFYGPGAATDVAGGMDINTPISENTYYHDFQIELKNDSADTTVGIGIDSIVNNVSNAMKGAVRVAVVIGNPGESSDELTLTATTSNTKVYVYGDGTTNYAPTWVKYPVAADALGNVTYTGEVVGPLKNDWQNVTDDGAWATAAAGEAKTYDTFDTTIVTLNPQQYVRMTIRVWFEGQDASCISANAGSDANIAISFKITEKTAYVAPETTEEETEAP